ncbi:MAG: hypothetical protein ABIF40_03400 [archaeon]
MNIKTKKSRLEVIETLKNVVDSLMPEFNTRLVQKLRPQERRLYQRLGEITFDEGNWYRPHHNFIVTAAMNQICRKNSFLRREALMSLAMLHDIGYSRLKINIQGADWESADKRIAHMVEGAHMYREIMVDMHKNGKYHLNPIRLDDFDDGPYSSIEDCAHIVAVHDNPYIGKTIDKPDGLHLRDADRLYVCSFSSFVKDYLNYLDKEMKLTAEQFVQRRAYSFIRPEEQNPLFLIMPDRPEQFYEKKYEPFILEHPKKLWTQQIMDRGFEVRCNRMFDMDIQEFKYYAEKELQREAEQFLS